MKIFINIYSRVCAHAFTHAFTHQTSPPFPPISSPCLPSRIGHTALASPHPPKGPYAHGDAKNPLPMMMPWSLIWNGPISPLCKPSHQLFYKILDAGSAKNARNYGHAGGLFAVTAAWTKKDALTSIHIPLRNPTPLPPAPPLTSPALRPCSLHPWTF